MGKTFAIVLTALALFTGILATSAVEQAATLTLEELAQFLHTWEAACHGMVLP
jgi:hypothetical protein